MEMLNTRITDIFFDNILFDHDEGMNRGAGLSLGFDVYIHTINLKEDFEFFFTNYVELFLSILPRKRL